MRFPKKPTRMTGKMTTQTVFWYAIVAAIGFILVMTMVYPIMQGAIGPWWSKLIGVEEPTVGEVPEGFIYSGTLDVNLYSYDVYDDSSYDPADAADINIWHANEATVFGTTTTLDGTDLISGQVWEEDLGILYMSIDHDSGTTEYLLDAESDEASGYLTALSPKDVDNDGTLEHYFKVDVTKLSPLTAGETKKTITVNLYWLDSDYAVGITSQLNASDSGLNSATYLDLYASGYIDSIALGDGFKIVKVEINTGTTGTNETYFEDAKVKDLWMTLGYGKDKTYTWNSYDYAYSGSGVATRFTFNIGVTDWTQEVNGLPIIAERGTGTSFATYNIHIKGANFGAGESWQPTLKIWYIQPDGTTGTIEQVVAFTDT